MALQYTDKVMEYFKCPKHAGTIPDANATATEGSAACGDFITMQLKVDEKTQKIKDVKYKSFGCASNIATAEVIAKLAIGKTIKQAKKIGHIEVTKHLGGLPKIKVHCSVLAVETLQAAIRDYEVKHGLAKLQELPFNKEEVIKELMHVMNPEIGLNIYRLKMVKDVQVTRDSVKIVISMGNTDMSYAANIKSEIEEHMQKFKNARQIEVKIER
jgi:nitrogen fixation NifU-like protein